MRIALVTPGVPNVTTGNLRSSQDYRSIFESLGHHVTVSESWDPTTEAEILVALHASKSHASITRFRSAHPNKHLILVLTGTDIYPDPNPLSLESMALADRVVTLQDRAPDKIPEQLRHKNRTIIHSATPSGFATSDKTEAPFDVVVAGHLRDVKDPMRAALASRLLPDSSNIRIRHAGSVLEEKYRAEVETEIRENPRYEYLGQMTPVELKRLTARSQLMVISSINEGGARIVGESIVDGTPVLSSRIDGVLGLLGDDYPGFFPVRDSQALAALMSKFESDLTFRNHLQRVTDSLKPRFAPDKQTAGWQNLLNEIA